MDKLKFIAMNITFSLSSGLDLRDPKVRFQDSNFLQVGDPAQCWQSSTVLNLSVCTSILFRGHYINLVILLRIASKFHIGGFRNSQSDVIFAHAHIRGRQRFVQLYGICVKCGFIF